MNEVHRQPTQLACVRVNTIAQVDPGGGESTLHLDLIQLPENIPPHS